MEKEFRKVNADVSKQIRALRKEVEAEFGIVARISARALGPVLQWTTRREEQRLAQGWTYEPPTIVERTNWSLQLEPLNVPDTMNSEAVLLEA